MALSEAKPGNIDGGVYIPRGMTHRDVEGAIPSTRYERIEDGYFVPQGWTLEEVIEESFTPLEPQVSGPIDDVSSASIEPQNP